MRWRPVLKVAETNGRAEVSLDHPDLKYGAALFMQALATSEVDFYAEILSQLAKASAPDGKVDERQLNFMVAVIKGIQPKDQLETMLAAQMAAVHALSMNMAGRMGDVSMLPQMEIVGRLFTNLTRTFAAQLEALKRWFS